MKVAVLFIVASLLVLPACGSRSTARLPDGQRMPASPPAMIGHIVFVQLQNPNDFHEILNDSDWMLGTIPTVSTFAAGKHLDTGRSTVSADYDLAIYLGFNSESDLAAYVRHDQHIGFVNKWKPRLKSLRVYDMLDWPTTRYDFIGY